MTQSAGGRKIFERRAAFQREIIALVRRPYCTPKAIRVELKYLSLLEPA
ncbi:MAG TPA: hypothetical protein VGW77_29250 [Candidatus Binatia bacterium]|jgi:hypothetical protein|nr:hypothetical protein [Candidatus Binatia bacterium]